jgi:3-hydroxyisobutyrate dehydrogenase/2-hydroxy-3-oxopropionate reductase
MKLAVNLIVHNLNAAVAEALTLATSAGITATAYDVFEESVVAAPFVLYKRAFLDPGACRDEPRSGEQGFT